MPTSQLLLILFDLMILDSERSDRRVKSIDPSLHSEYTNNKYYSLYSGFNSYLIFTKILITFFIYHNTITIDAV